MKKYPKLNWKQLTQEQKDLFDKVEEHILWNKEVLEWTVNKDNIGTLAYNSAFCIITDNKIKL